jgi:hypothetical protein
MASELTNPGKAVDPDPLPIVSSQEREVRRARHLS